MRHALSAVFKGAVGKDVVSRTWRKVKGDWDAWNTRYLADAPIVRLSLAGTVVRVRLGKKATSISLLVALGVQQDGQKMLLERFPIRWIHLIETGIARLQGVGGC